MKPNSIERLPTCLSWTAALSLLTYIAPTITTSATVSPIDEPPCYMRTQDGRIVNLQSLCSRTVPQQAQPSPATSQPMQRTRFPQAAPSQGNVPTSPQRDPSGSHANGNPDSDDGNY